MPLDNVLVNAQVTIAAAELQVDFVRSSGPGGQHVNKTSSQAQLRWRLNASQSLTDEQKKRLREKLESRLTLSGELVICCDRHRSRERNLAECTTRLSKLIAEALTRPRTRRPTRPTRGSKERRLDGKRRRSQTKRLRKPPE